MSATQAKTGASQSMLNKIMILNLALVITHQIDAAYWHEWEMFGIPGGIKVFNLMNVVILIILLACAISVIEKRKHGFACSLMIAFVCALVLPIHSGFALAGFDQFNLPVSIALIILTFIGAAMQCFVTLKQRDVFVH